MKLNRILMVLTLAAACVAGMGSAFAQDGNAGDAGGRRNRGGGQGGPGGPGGFDPAKMQERMMEMYKDRLGFTNETEWSAVLPLVQKVTEARRATMSGMGGGMFRRRGGDNNGGGDNGPRRGGFGEPSPEAEALQKALDDKAPAAQVKAALERYRVSRKDKEAKLQGAQDDLRKVLSSRQEAEAVLLGLLT